MLRYPYKNLIGKTPLEIHLVVDIFSPKYENLMLMGGYFNSEPGEAAKTDLYEINDTKNLPNSFTCDKAICINLILTNKLKSLKKTTILEVGPLIFTK